VTATWLSVDAIKSEKPYACVGGPFGSELTTRDYTDDGVPVIRGNNLSGDCRFRDEAFVFVSEHKAASLVSNMAYPGDLLFTQRGTLGQVGLIPEQPNFDRYIVSQSQMKLSVNASLVLPEFVYYWFRQRAVVETIKLRAVSSGVPHINLGILKNLDLRVPPLPEQREIVRILRDLDDLIENNRRRIQLLEQSTRLLYREWFIDLRFPSHEDVKAADGVPRGWAARALGDVCTSIEDGDWIESKDQGGEDFRLLQVSNIGIGEFVETGNFRFITEETFRRLRCREVAPGDILISRMPDPVGRAWLVTNMPWRMITAVDVAIAKVDERLVSAFFVLHHLNSPQSIELAEKHASGATRLRISRKSLCALPVRVPPRVLQEDFAEFAQTNQTLRSNLERQNTALRKVRDLWLPRLMSGEIAV
jgi:type I restriction enzyme, S subunit